MAGALQLIARLQAAPVPPVPPCKNSGEPLEAAPLLVVPPVPPVPPQKRKSQNQCAEPDPAQFPQIEEIPQRIVHTAATASPEWIASRDSYISHLMTCRDCHAPTGRYCAAGADLRQRYESIKPDHMTAR